MYTLHWTSFVRWMYGTGVVLILDKQNVCLYCLNLTRVIGYRCSMRSQSHFHTLSKCIIMYNYDNDSALINWRWTISAYVCISACVLELGGVVGDRHSMHEVVISPCHTPQWRYLLYIDLCLLNVQNRCFVVSGGTVCTFRSYIACISHTLLVIMRS